MTQTLDWREALGNAPVAIRSADERTIDLDQVMRSLVTGGHERGSVRNFLVRSARTDTPGWTARAALDTDHRRLISMMFEAVVGGHLDEDDVAARLVERVFALRSSLGDAEEGRWMPEHESAALHVVDAAIDSTILDRVSQLARECFPAGSTVEWSDEVDESGDVYNLMTVHSPAAPAATHESYRAFIDAWVRAEPPEIRSRIRVSCRPGAGG